ncbi:DUF3299 domain-containing protein [bacterium]|nr:DUF3299 domain-containing protein [bacterium]
MASTATLIDFPTETSPNEFQYRPVPPLVPVSAAFILLSITAFMWDMLVIVPVIGCVLAFLAWRQVARSPQFYSGGIAARVIFSILVIMAVGASSLHAYSFATEVPEGFERVSFATDISEKGFVVDEGKMGLHPDVQKLTDQPVFLKGYMYPTKQTHDLETFVLCKDSGDCCFGGQPKVTDMIYVEMAKGKLVHHRTGLVAVAGTFKATPTLDPTGLNPVYKLECEFFSGAKTSY